MNAGNGIPGGQQRGRELTWDVIVFLMGYGWAYIMSGVMLKPLKTPLITYIN